MKRLNNKGYITIEVLIASIVAAVIAVFLIEITVRLVGRTDDAYVDTVLNTDKVLIIDNVKGNIINDISYYKTISSVDCASNVSCTIRFSESGEQSEIRKIIVDNDTKTIKYCDGREEIERECFYSKNLNSALSNINITSNINNAVNEGAYIFFQITAENIFSDKAFMINIPILNRYEEAIPPITKYSVKIRFSDYIILEEEVNYGDDFIGTTSAINDTFASPADINVTCSPVVNVDKAKGNNGFTFTIRDVRNNIECNITQNNNLT